MKTFYSRLSYSFGNEDPDSEMKALRVTENDTVLSITASGDRPLHLLQNPVKEVVTLDVNPVQTALFDLKRRAMEHLEYDDYLALLGIKPSEKREFLFETIAPWIPPASLAFWRERFKLIKKGVVFQGVVERTLIQGGAVVRLIRPEKIKKLFSFDSIAEQKKFVENEWNPLIWEKAIHFTVHPIISRYFIKDPGLYENVPPKLHVGDYIFQRLNRYLLTHLAKKSVLGSLLIYGGITPAGYPPYIEENGVKEITKQLHKVKVHTQDLLSFLETAPENSFDCFAISDVASYLPPKEFRRLCTLLIKTAKPGARFCMREFLSRHEIPQDLAPFFERDISLEKTLEEDDHCFVYRFIVGRVLKK